MPGKGGVAGRYEGRKGASRFLIALATQIHVESHAVHWRAVAGLNVFIAGSSTFEATSTGRKMSHDWVEQFVVSREGKISKLEFFYDADQYSDAFQADLGSETDGEAHSGRSEKSLS